LGPAVAPLGSGIFLLGGLMFMVVAFQVSNSYYLFVSATAALLIFFFIFAALLVRSYKRDKKKLIEKNPYHNDHIIH
jgi:hypothetical protein